MAYELIIYTSQFSVERLKEDVWFGSAHKIKHFTEATLGCVSVL
jgi:hypothetical protein